MSVVYYIPNGMEVGGHGLGMDGTSSVLAGKWEHPARMELGINKFVRARPIPRLRESAGSSHRKWSFRAGATRGAASEVQHIQRQAGKGDL